jgi:hypothetical protein
MSAFVVAVVALVGCIRREWLSVVLVVTCVALVNLVHYLLDGFVRWWERAPPPEEEDPT